MQKHRDMLGIKQGDDLRHVDTSLVLTEEERLAARNEGMRRSFRWRFPGMTPRVVISGAYLDPVIARQFVYVKVA